MKLLFVRHGEPDYDHDCLLPLGKQEAALVCDRLAGVDIDAFYVSPLGRARETAEPTLKRKGATAEVCDWLREFHAPIKRPDRNGELSIPWDWLPQDWTTVDEYYDPDKWYTTPLMREGQVEEEYHRVCSHFDQILAEFGYERSGRLYLVREPNTKTLCFFCHYGVTVVLLSHLLSVSPMPLWHGIMAAPASVSELVTEERREGIASFRLSHYGDTSHLDAAGLAPNPNGLFTELYSDFSQRHD
ncbi:MAG: histidine phosphatase family protein [Lachnospiraceae bacterium]|nr:histidine phosphatase family protein [Lachnospiraceae bacterium]